MNGLIDSTMFFMRFSRWPMSMVEVKKDCDALDVYKLQEAWFNWDVSEEQQRAWLKELGLE